MPDDRPLDEYTILMVDDDPELARLHAIVLPRAGAEVTHAVTLHRITTVQALSDLHRRAA